MYQIVAAKSNEFGHWFRAKIIDVLLPYDSDMNKTLYKVYYVDLGEVELISINDLYPINEKFLYLPFCACNFTIFNLEALKINMNQADLVRICEKIKENFSDCTAMVNNHDPEKCYFNLETFLVDYNKNKFEYLSDYVLDILTPSQ
jgi:hypothetical protein